MTVEHIEVLVEEPSMEVALRVLLPRVLGNLSFEVYPYQCKEELLAKLPNRLNGYRRWLPQNWRILVAVDRDNDDCRALKQRLERMAQNVGLPTRSVVGGAAYSVVNRLVIEELEAWYFGDWQAVRAAYPRVSERTSRKAAYRNPDAIRGGTWEAFEREMRRAGYFRSGLRKIDAARAIAAHWNVDANSSRSFQVFRDVLLEMATL